MRVAFFELEPWQPDYLRNGLQRLGIAEAVTVCFCAEPLSSATVAQYADSEAIAVFIWTKLDRALLEALPNLRLVLTMSTGYDHIDLATCQERGITVCNVPHYGENTVAEHTFALILSLSRKLHAAYFQGLRGEYRIPELRGFDLYGKTLGVIGAGHIGLHVIRIARGFGMRVLAYDVRPYPLLAEVLGFAYTDLDTLLRESDIVSLHVPAQPDTHHLINRETLSKMKRGALLINTARGSVVDTEALLWALNEGILAGAGLDVIEGEEYIKEESALLKMPVAEQTFRQVVQAHLLLKRDNVVFTPHIAFNSQEAVQRILDTTLENLKAFLAGGPRNVVG
ncbi:MAG: hydroxyacid dehydrogenase [Bacteroidetes bacterium]|nr:hydroxyacid dehydrogenase [Rhodothermia bacterium]MCS7155722.1 hydroxyacid dehydrogenase [Bacteroidota bacterium]MCX7906576.1 hydroxyacid dehydrogenase [Bacteroidota bacterium]MDW8137143.1 hydroxyacid dehydrogenase [Bacteroidota bacterium]MDW8284987.1 hydroxyacid dehydrogenase [Bacteroidota bacterium]